MNSDHPLRFLFWKRSSVSPGWDDGDHERAPETRAFSLVLVGLLTFVLLPSIYSPSNRGLFGVKMLVKQKRRHMQTDTL